MFQKELHLAFARSSNPTACLPVGEVQNKEDDA